MRAIGVVLAGVVLVAGSAVAHHAIEEQFDSTHPVLLEGVVTKVAWVNPHMRLFVDVKDRAGTVTNWEVDMGSPTIQILRGWKIDTVRPGDSVSIKASPARDGSKVSYAEKVKVSVKR